jgi:hypothetical protein
MVNIAQIFTGRYHFQFADRLQQYRCGGLTGVIEGNAFMIHTIRPLDRPDPGLERVAKANGFSLHAGVIGYMLITILSAVAQAERARILERTNEGREAAKEKGIQFDRKPHKGSDKALGMIRKGMAAKEVMDATGVSRATYFRLKKTA